MSSVSPSLADILRGLESRAHAFDLDDAHDEVEAYAKSHPQRSPDDDQTVRAELIALGLFAGQPQEVSPWGTHFGPTWASKNGEYPPLAALTVEMVAYWKSRAKASAHPRLRARYGDAAWDLEPKVANDKRDPEMARVAINAYVDDCGRPGMVAHQIEGLRRALYLALKLGDEDRVASVRDAIIAFQKRIADPSEPGSVCFHFDALYEQRKKLKLSAEQIGDMIAGMEKQLAEWSEPAGRGFDPFSARDLGCRLVQHYRASNSPADVKRVVQTYAKALLHLAGQANGTFAHHWLEELHQDYLDAGLRTEADALVPDIKKAGERMVGEMGRVSVPITIPGEEMEQFCQAITEGGEDVAAARIADAFTLDMEDLREEMHKVAAAHPLMAHIQVVIADEFTRARVGGVRDDEAGRLVMHVHQHLAFDVVYLHHAIDRLVSRYTLSAEQLVALLYRSELFEEARRPLLVVGVRHYLGGDHASCAHVLIPQVEHLLRRLLGTLGGVTVSLDSETNTYREKDLGSVLRDPRMEQFWKQMTKKDIAFYLRVVLTDHRALNARNRVCHGLCDPGWFMPQVTDRLLHVLLLLSLLRVNKPETASHPDSEVKQ